MGQKLKLIILKSFISLLPFILSVLALFLIILAGIVEWRNDGPISVETICWLLECFPGWSYMELNSVAMAVRLLGQLIFLAAFSLLIYRREWRGALGMIVIAVGLFILFSLELTFYLGTLEDYSKSITKTCAYYHAKD